ncbi:MAG: DUF2087 domain-containing protein [Anaerolineae bacterium]|jgi:hypothetical protein|nr:DUF2087 domain-containing protein [Anaerolineae bacterium]
MDSKEQVYFLSMLKAIADPTRLQLLRLVSEKGYPVQEIARIIDLPEEIVSQDLNYLHANGFLRLSMMNNQRLYQFKQDVVQILVGYVQQLSMPLKEAEKPISDNRWIDELDASSEDKNILSKWTFDGRLTDFPIKDKEWAVILRWVASKFEANVRYTEKQVNEIITTHIHPDYATIRRSLIEDGFMKRERGGAAYWLNTEK